MPDSRRKEGRPGLLANLLGFCRYLRWQGLTVGANQVLDFIEALGYINILRRDSFFHAAETTLLNRAQDRERFRMAFRRYWHRRHRGLVPTRDQERTATKQETTPEFVTDTFRWLPAELTGQASPAAEDGAGQRYTALEVLRRKDFAELSESEREQVSRLVREMSFRLGTRRSRRWIPGSGSRIELRRSLRLNLRHGGEWLRWARKSPKLIDRPVVLLADISGSMERYSRILLHFSFGLVKGSKNGIEAFVFGTRLTRITRALEVKRIERAVARVARAVPDWSGGTRIGEALRRFNLDWARRVLARRPAVLIVSDGWDRGDPRLLAREVARLQRSSWSLIWLNPRLGAPDFHPETRGMRAALPYIDHFLPVHNLQSLDAIAQLLEGLEVPGERRAGGSGSGKVRLEGANG